MYRYWMIGNYSIGFDMPLWKTQGYSLRWFSSPYENVWGPFVWRRWSIRER